MKHVKHVMPYLTFDVENFFFRIFYMADEATEKFQLI